MFSKIKKAGMKWATSPQAMKLMTNPNVQKALMKALQLPSDVRSAVQERTAKFADFADLATRNDVQTFVRTIRDLERDVQKLKKELDLERQKAAAARSAAPSTPATGTAAASVSATPAAATASTTGVGPAVMAEIRATGEGMPPGEAPKKTKIIAKKKPVEPA